MKRTFLVICFITCAICAWADQYDQQYFSDAKSVLLEKAGTLSKILGKDVEEIVSLQIKGEMSNKDMKALAQCTKLRKLNLRYANLEKTKYFPSFDSLEVLFLPDDQYIPIEYFNMIPENKGLKVLMICTFKYYTQPTRDLSGYKEFNFSHFTSLSKVLISGHLERKCLYNNEHGIVSQGPILVDTVIYRSNSVPKDELFKARLYEGVKHLFYIGDKTVDFSKIEAVRAPERIRNGNSYVKMRPSIPSILNLQNMKYIGSDYFNDTEVEEVTFSSSSLEFGVGIYNGYKGAFNRAQKLRKIIFASTIKDLTIPAYTFAECPALETVIFECPVTIEENAFGEYSNLKEIIFNESAVINSHSFYSQDDYLERPSITKVTFNAAARIEKYGFEDIEEVVFNAPVNIKSNGIQNAESVVFNDMPVSLAEDFATCKNITIPSEEGALENFLSYGISPEYLIDPTANLSLDIVVTEPGNILKYLPIDKLTQIKSLTVTGRLYETDIAILKQCTNLQYLNLSDTYITESPISQEHRQAENKMWADLEELLAIDAEVKYETGQNSKRESRQQVAAAIHAAAIMQQDDMPECYIPTDAFENMRLVEVALPKTVKKIYRAAFRNCKSLTKVDLGEALVTIGVSAFENTRLKEITIPTTLTNIYEDAFNNVRNLKILDLSHCAIDEYSTISGLNTTIGYMPDLEVFYMPNKINSCAAFSFGCPKLMDFYVGKDVKSIDREISNINLHFQSELAPEIGMFSKVSNCTIYVPKNGNLTSYYAKFNGNGNKIVQE
jgi:Leucine-rich repeat (LRR) protein